MCANVLLVLLLQR